MVKVTRLPLLCFLENALAFISSVPRLILVKGLGHFLFLSYPVYFACLLLFCCLNQKPPKYLPLSVCSLFLIQCHLSVPSAPRWDRHPYLSKSYNSSSRLVGYQELFIGAVNGRGDPTKPINFTAISRPVEPCSKSLRHKRATARVMPAGAFVNHE